MSVTYLEDFIAARKASVQAAAAAGRAVDKANDKFIASAIACHYLVTEAGMSLPEILVAIADTKLSNGAGGDVAYQSKSPVSWHAATGRLMLLPELGDDDTMGKDAQSAISKVYKRKGLGQTAVISIIDGATSRGGAVEALKEALKAVAPAVTIAKILEKVATMVADGFPVTAEDRKAYAALFSVLGVDVAPVLTVAA